MNLKHVALYAKHWYERTDVWEDLKKCLTADNYTPENKYDILGIIISSATKLFERQGINQFAMQLIFEVQPSQIWKYGYYTKDHAWLKNTRSEEEYNKLPDYDYLTAVLYFYLSRIANSEIKELGGMDVKPDSKILPLSKDATKKKIKEFFK